MVSSHPRYVALLGSAPALSRNDASVQPLDCLSYSHEALNVLPGYI